jgi:thiamine-phosphate pyrophosphorylase
VTLPRLLVLTDRRQLPADRRLDDTVRACSAAGGCGFVVRELDLPPRQRRHLVTRLADTLDGELVVSARAWLADCHGVHLSAAQPDQPAAPLRGRSCHSADEVRRAVDDCASYVTVSPVATSASKPGYGPAIGTDGLRLAVRAAGDVPVYALGGVDVDNAAAMRDAGAHGVAVMGAVMRAQDPALVVHTLNEEVAT